MSFNSILNVKSTLFLVFNKLIQYSPSGIIPTSNPLPIDSNAKSGSPSPIAPSHPLNIEH